MSNDIDIKLNLAKAYRFLAWLKMDDLTYTHLSSLSSDGKHFFIYPFGLLFQEVTSDILLKVTLDGEIIEGKEYQYNRTGYIIHGSIYKARSDIKSIFHLHTIDGTAVSAMQCGLLPITQWALHFYNKVAYHNYNSLALNHDINITKDLSDKYIMFLRNHGTITCGRTIYEAFFYTHHLEKACQAQCKIMAATNDFIIPNTNICEKSVSDLLSFEKELGKRDWQALERIVK